MNSSVYLTAREMASAIRSREISSVELVDHLLQRIKKINQDLNAIITIDEESIRKRAEEADKAIGAGINWGSLHGVPITIKDVFETENLRTTSSSHLLLDNIPKKDATVVARLKQAGAIILGKTNMPELAMDAQSISPIFGQANNPWNLLHTTGGSTGGGAAAVAAGLSPIEIGSDIGGSIRFPAHCCGVFGLKPTEHLVSMAGHIPPLPGTVQTIRHFNTSGPLARSVGDLRLVLDVIAGPDERDLRVPPVKLEHSNQKYPRQHRIAWFGEVGGVPITHETKAALQTLAEKLEAQNWIVEEIAPAGFDFEIAWKTFGEILGTETAVNLPLHKRLSRVWSPIRFRNSPTWRSEGICWSADKYLKAIERRDQLLHYLETFLSQFDAWLIPVASSPAFKHQRPVILREGIPIDVDKKKIPYWVAISSFTTPFNLTGNPVVVIPVAISSDGLPIGIQVVGKKWEDNRLLSICEEIVQVSGPFIPPPNYPPDYFDNVN